MELSYSTGALFYTKIHETEVFQYISELDWPVKKGVKAMGIYEHEKEMSSTCYK